MGLKFTKVATVNEVPPGTARVVEVDGEQIAICNVDGEFYAVSNECTHDGGSLDQGELDGETIECPRHGARFNVKTGEVVAPPAFSSVDTFPVRVLGKDVEVSAERA
ncbi:MAG: non-heme iron oxygenase ferredoxin subunit [Chloroflexi bacterium]|nr:non-heme iron oxygenase ferredoxin subunit [Chloroflexota bacterium]